MAVVDTRVPWLTGGKPIVKSVNRERGDRPWMLRPSKAD
jgi:hypothetical protein